MITVSGLPWAAMRPVETTPEGGDGVKVGATYEATGKKIAKVDGFISQTGEDAATRKATYEESVGWYAGITTDMFS